MAKKSAHSLQRLYRAFGYSRDGLKAAFATETAFREELLATAILLPLVFFLNVTAAAKALMIASLFLILIAELANTAMEAIVDRISEEPHPLAKKAKDTGSALVLLALVNAVLVWGILLADVIW